MAIARKLYAARRYARSRRARTVALLIAMILTDFLVTATVFFPLLRGTDITALSGSFLQSLMTLMHFILLIVTPADASTRERSAPYSRFPP